MKSISIKIIVAIILLPLLIVVSILIYSASKNEFIGLGGLIPIKNKLVLSQKIKVKQGAQLESVSVLIGEQRLDAISVFLESPAGIRIELTRGNGKDGHWYYNTTFNDNARSLIFAANAPFEGTYRPHQFIGWLNKGALSGKWKLIVDNHHPYSCRGVVVYWKLKFGNHPVTLKTIETSTLPILIINTKNQEQPFDDKKIEASVYYTNGTASIQPVDCKLKLRGFSSRNLPKKNYSLDITQDADSSAFNALNLIGGCDWVLNGNCMDKSLIRNSLIYKLYSESGHEASIGKHVEVILNGAYIGIYVLQNKLKPTYSFLTEISNNPHGFLVKIDSPVDDKKGFYNNTAGWNAEHKIYYQYVFPAAKKIKPEQEQFIQKSILHFESELGKKPSIDSLNDLIDVNSFADYFIFQELSKNNDGYNLSCNIYADKNQHIAIGPVWDFDRALGNSNNESTHLIEGWKISDQKKNQYHPVPVWWRNLLLNAQFRSTVTKRWNTLSQTTLSESNINHLIDSLSQSLNNVQERNSITWPVWGINQANFYTKPSIKNYGDEINDLRKWILQRKKWMDAEIEKPIL